MPEGTCVGLLGPNGAGKSTTMKLLTAQAIADEGEIEVLGYTLPARVEGGARRVRRRAAARQPRHDADGRAEPARVHAPLPDRPRASAAPRSSARSSIANLADRRDTNVDKLSGGMRRRLLIARALVHRPRLVLLDEPTVGLDPQVRQELWALIDALRTEGVSILMSTHYIEEAERLADTVTIMSHGQAVATGPPRELIAEHAGAEAVEVYGPPAQAARGRARRAGGRASSTRRTGTVVSILRSSANGAPRGRAPPREPRGRVRPAHRGGDRR